MNSFHHSCSPQKRPKTRGAGRKKNRRGTKRDPAARWSSCQRLENPVRSPTREDWSAMLDVDAKWLHLAQWLLKQAERGQSVTARRMARELGIRTQTACSITNPTDQFGRRIAGWVEWARYVIGERYNPTGLDYRFPHEYISPTNTSGLNVGNSQQRHYPYLNQSLAGQPPFRWETTGKA